MRSFRRSLMLLAAMGNNFSLDAAGFGDNADLNSTLQDDFASFLTKTSEPKPGTGSGRPGKRPGKRGRKPSKVDVKVKLERSRQSARECRARKKLRYQYLEELVSSRERAIYALRDELEQIKGVCLNIDKGEMPQDCLDIVEKDSEREETRKESNMKASRNVNKAKGRRKSSTTHTGTLASSISSPGSVSSVGSGSSAAAGSPAQLQSDCALHLGTPYVEPPEGLSLSDKDRKMLQNNLLKQYMRNEGSAVVSSGGAAFVPLRRSPDIGQLHPAANSPPSHCSHEYSPPTSVRSTDMTSPVTSMYDVTGSYAVTSSTGSALATISEESLSNNSYGTINFEDLSKASITDILAQYDI